MPSVVVTETTLVELALPPTNTFLTLSKYYCFRMVIRLNFVVGLQTIAIGFIY